MRILCIERAIVKRMHPVTCGIPVSGKGVPHVIYVYRKIGENRMEIERINACQDSRFDPDILRQHGAFLIDGRYPCGFRILDGRSAKITMIAGIWNC